ncbi:MAG: B-box zinc finger protein [Candidatus Eremiobacterota bacterium]
MGVSYCLKHQDRPTETRCTSCLKPICQECTVITPDGKYCSETCHQNALTSREKIAEMKRQDAEVERERRRAALIRNVVSLAILVGVVMAWPHLPAGIREPVEKLFRSILSAFR